MEIAGETGREVGCWREWEGEREGEEEPRVIVQVSAEELVLLL